ncbi:MAG TPA: hypothetical protein VLC52_00420 [Anaerolineae bacterium]|nr:hypothetical protein [Anaerolineae bacterium]
MSQGIRDMLANKKFAIPLIVLLGFCLIGLILVGVVLLLRPGADAPGEPTQQVAGEVITPSVTAIELVTFTPAPTNTPTPRPSATLVPVATVAGGGEGTPGATDEVGGGEGTPGATDEVGGGAGSPTPGATATATSPATGGQATATTAVSQATATTAPTPAEGELAQTGLGWGLILFSGAGLAGLAVAARRLRLSGG